MTRKCFFLLLAFLIIGLAAAVSGTVPYGNQRYSAPPSTSANITSTATNTSIAGGTTCVTNFSDFAVPPLPTSSFKWVQLTLANATSLSPIPPSFSSSTGEMINPDAFSASSQAVTTTLPGNLWFSFAGDLNAVDSYYRSILQQEGWVYQANVSGYQIYAMQAGGYHGVVDGFIKVSGGYLRSVVLDYETGAPLPQDVNVFISDIVPLSLIIPDYQPTCPLTGLGAVPI